MATDALPYAWYGDDFTGASDTLATLAAAGRRALLFFRPPTAAQRRAAGPLEALGIAGIGRALAPDALRAELAPVAACLAELAPVITHYKCCSTFDSAPQAGNLAIGTQALRRPDHDPLMPIFGGQPSLGRYCAFGHLFASAGTGGPVYRIDRHPTMSAHPVTPMVESDLRLHLRRLGLGDVGLIDLRSLDADAQAVHQAADVACAGPPGACRALLLDGMRDAHLQTAGRWLWQRATRQPQLVLGASSVAQAALAHWPRASRGAEATGPQPCAPHRGIAPAASPVFLLVGSLSPVTDAQVRQALDLYQPVPIDPAVVLGSDRAMQALIGRCSQALRQGRSVIARTVSPVAGDAAQAGATSALEVASLCGCLMAEVLRRNPFVRRAGVAGGDTSSLALRALGAWALGWTGQMDPGVALARVHADDPALDGLELMLKGGQMGAPDLMRRLQLGSA